MTDNVRAVTELSLGLLSSPGCQESEDPEPSLGLLHSYSQALRNQEARVPWVWGGGAPALQTTE